MKYLPHICEVSINKMVRTAITSLDFAMNAALISPGVAVSGTLRTA